MILIICILMIIYHIDDIKNINRKYMRIKRYSVYYLSGIFIELLFWITWFYFEYNDLGYVPYTFLILPFGYTLYFKGLYNLDIILNKNKDDIGYQLNKFGYKSLLIYSVFIVILTIACELF